MVLVSVVIVAFILQVVLIIADHHDSPGLAAVQFSKAYFKLSPSMAKWLCSELTTDEESNVVGDYINRMADEARANGFKPSWKKMALPLLGIPVWATISVFSRLHLMRLATAQILRWSPAVWDRPPMILLPKLLPGPVG